MKPPRESLNEAIAAAYARAARAARSGSRVRPDDAVFADGALRLADAVMHPDPPSHLGLVPDVLGAVLQNADAGGAFSTFALVVRATGLTRLPRGLGPFTLFAPTNRAFGRLSVSEREALFADADRLAALLTHHLVARRVRAPRPGAPIAAMTVGGHALHITVDGSTFRVNGARVVMPHIYTADGTVRGIDTVFLPA